MLDDIKEFLINLKYPNIVALSEDEIANLFLSQNVPVFFRWFVGELIDDPAAAAAFEDKELVEILNNFCYCTETQKEALMKSALPFDQQYAMIYKMLSTLSIIKKPQCTEDDSFDAIDTVSLDELNDLITQKLNLFATHAPMKKISDKDQEEHVTTLKEQIQELEDRMKLQKEDLAEKISLASVKTEPKEECDAKNCNLSAAIGDFLFSTSNISELTQNLKLSSDCKAKGEFSEAFPSLLLDCSSDALDLHEYFSNLSMLDSHNSSEVLVGSKEITENARAVEKLLTIAEEL